MIKGSVFQGQGWKPLRMISPVWAFPGEANASCPKGVFRSLSPAIGK